MLLENDSAGLQFKAKLTMANVPALVGFALGRKHAGVPVDQQLIDRHVECPPEPFALKGADHVSSDHRECKDGDVERCYIASSLEHKRGERIQLIGLACQYVWLEQ